MLRIIAGSAKGRRIDTPTWEGLRPTSDRLRETLFNIIAARVPGARVVDGYAGTGALGIEALSRGAARVTFIEKDPRALKLIRSNLDACGFDGAIIRSPFVDAADALGQGSVDLVLLDPPYGDPQLFEAVRAGLAILSDDGVLVLEHATRVVPPGGAYRTVKAGDSSLSFYEKRNG